MYPTSLRGAVPAKSDAMPPKKKKPDCVLLPVVPRAAVGRSGTATVSRVDSAPPVGTNPPSVPKTQPVALSSGTSDAAAPAIKKKKSGTSDAAADKKKRPAVPSAADAGTHGRGKKRSVPPSTIMQNPPVLQVTREILKKKGTMTATQRKDALREVHTLHMTEKISLEQTLHARSAVRTRAYSTPARAHFFRTQQHSTLLLSVHSLLTQTMGLTHLYALLWLRSVRIRGAFRTIHCCFLSVHRPYVPLFCLATAVTNAFHFWWN